eukprot:scaffold187559_cov30-Tisochrysis_lutea.AAC.3
MPMPNDRSLTPNELSIRGCDTLSPLPLVEGGRVHSHISGSAYPTLPIPPHPLTRSKPAASSPLPPTAIINVNRHVTAAESTMASHPCAVVVASYTSTPSLTPTWCREVARDGKGSLAFLAI